MLAAVYSGYAQPPVASITATPTSGCAPLGVSFNGLASGVGPFTWTWTINGGSPNTSALQNPSSIFNTPGNYTVSLVVKNASGNSNTATVQITVNPTPVADFLEDKKTGCYPTHINFTNTSTAGGGGTITSYSWSFGDGTQDTAKNPNHIYTLAGTFPVTLYVTNSFGCTGNTQIKNVQNAVTITGGISVNFSNSLNSSCTLPVTASFANTSTGPPVLSYLWNFGDGSPTDNTPSPSHPYSVANNYVVKLAVTSSQGCSDTLSQNVNITASGNLTDYTAPDTVCIGTSVTFKNISSPFPNSSSWNYGDGSPVDIARDGHHSYATPGIYAVQLTNTFSGCNGSITKNLYVVNPPVTSFSGTNIANCQPPLTSTFTNTSTGATSWYWDFGDGSSSTLQNPLPHTYTTSGIFNVTLTSSAGSGCSNAVQKVAYVKIQKPVVGFSNLPAYGCAPYTFTPAANIITVDGVATYNWNFGNGNTSTLQNPPPQTFAAGLYNVKLIITTNGGCSDTATGVVKVGSTKPVPAFSFVPPTACVKSAIQFTDLTPVGTSNQWLWEFGDGNTSTIENPTYSYLKPGTFKVRLTAYEDGCWDTLSQTIVINPPLADFKFTPVCGQKNSFIFTDNSTGPVTTWFWDFNDGSTFQVRIHPHMYFLQALQKHIRLL